jgi:hypothetical protein
MQEKHLWDMLLINDASKKKKDIQHYKEEKTVPFHLYISSAIHVMIE